MSETRYARVVPYVETASVALAVERDDLRAALDAVALEALRAHPRASLRVVASDYRVTLDATAHDSPMRTHDAVVQVERVARAAFERRGFVVIGRLM